ncbi:MAG TPA: asparagine synthase-related protein [Candidatus Binatus sp.]|nr:asparagine synthase-related protein [Candidatus Binatus sp.]
MLSDAMPGIVGLVDGGAPVDASLRLVRAMAARLRVHGGLRVEIDPAPTAPAVLGRVDLGILDPRPAPAVSADASCRAVLQGEVSGVPGGAAGVLERYLSCGEAALRGLSGSFAVALWDGRIGRLHLANDRFGLRNVYYAADADRLLFAPQAGALLADTRLSRELDAQAVAEFLTFQCVLLDRTLIEGIRLLPPASLLVFEPGRGARIEPTWRLRYRARPRDDHAAALATALRDAACRQAEGQRVVLPLSGGLDSRTLLAALPARPLRTLTYGRRDSDDIRLAARLAAIAGTEHHTMVLRPGYIAAEARTMVRRTDGMHSCLNAHAALLRDAGAAGDLILLGNGGDCLLDGLWPGPETASDEDIVAKLLSKLAIGLPPGLAGRVVAPGAAFADVEARAADGLRAALATVDGDSAFDRADAFNVVHRHRRWVLQGVPAQATHVEFRHPYYDDRVVEAALAVPAVLRADRRAHVEALKLLSPELARVRRQGKPFGFAVPQWRWQLHVASDRVRNGVRSRANRAGLNPFVARPSRRSFADYGDELRCGSRALLEDVLLAPGALERGFWQPDTLRRLVTEHLAGRANHANALGVVLTLELFLQDLEPVEGIWPAPLEQTA